jgi:hypothetical protein
MTTPNVRRRNWRRHPQAAEVLPELIGQKATNELMRRTREQQEWQRLCAYGEARFRARLQAEGLDLDRMTEEEVEDYIDRVIHEYRQEQREKERAGKETDIPPQ